MNSRISKKRKIEKETKTLDESEETKRSGVDEIEKIKKRKKERFSLKVNIMVIL
jgi:hypothetical protein